MVMFLASSALSYTFGPPVTKPSARSGSVVMQRMETDVGVGAGLAPATYAGGVVPRKAPPSPESSILVQGGSLRTWSYRSPYVEQVQVVLSTEGRPLDVRTASV